jgi:hypothetical protein
MSPILSCVLSALLAVVQKCALPYLESEWLWIKELAAEIVKVLSGTPPSPSLKSAAEHYNALSSVARSPEIKHS